MVSGLGAAGKGVFHGVRKVQFTLLLVKTSLFDVFLCSIVSYTVIITS